MVLGFELQKVRKLCLRMRRQYGKEYMPRSEETRVWISYACCVFSEEDVEFNCIVWSSTHAGRIKSSGSTSETE